jgi:hypothetical protein
LPKLKNNGFQIGDANEQLGAIGAIRRWGWQGIVHNKRLRDYQKQYSPIETTLKS